MTAVRQYQEENPLVICSGDLFNPSLSKYYPAQSRDLELNFKFPVSTVFKGRQMVPVLNEVFILY